MHIQVHGRGDPVEHRGMVIFSVNGVEPIGYPFFKNEAVLLLYTLHKINFRCEL